MTVAQIKAASKLLMGYDDSEIVSFIEIASEGAILWAGAPRNRAEKWLISRNGHVEEIR